jgi:hypothetical protein
MPWSIFQMLRSEKSMTSSSREGQRVPHGLQPPLPSFSPGRAGGRRDSLGASVRNATGWNAPRPPPGALGSFHPLATDARGGRCRREVYRLCPTPEANLSRHTAASAAIHCRWPTAPLPRSAGRWTRGDRSRARDRSQSRYRLGNGAAGGPPDGKVAVARRERRNRPGTLTREWRHR